MDLCKKKFGKILTIFANLRKIDDNVALSEENVMGKIGSMMKLSKLFTEETLSNIRRNFENTSKELNWDKNYTLVEEYIKENNKRPN